MIQCSVCLTIFTESEIEGISECPKCGTTHIPYRVGNDIIITLNILEARILTMWAANYAETFATKNPDSARALSNIIDKFRELRQDICWTMGDEVRKLREAFGKVEMTDNEGKPKEPLL